jgi:hypothetical protein
MTTRPQSNVGLEATNCLFKLSNELLDIIALYSCGSSTILDLSYVAASAFVAMRRML